MYIQESDYDVLIREEMKEVLLENYSEAKLKYAEQMALKQVKNYLAGKYDVDTIFNSERDAYLVMILIDCTLYHLYSSTVAEMMPKIRETRYQDALDWLTAVANGTIHADLPIKSNADGTKQSRFKISSRHKLNNHRW